MFFYTYVLQSLKDKKLYIGFTNNITERLKQHQSGAVSSTKSRRPFKLVYLEACLDEKMAIQREKIF